MIKREELTNPESCMSRALPDERTFVLLARDEIAPKVIREWCRLRCLHGKNHVKDPQIVEALECADLMDRERSDVKNAVKLSPGSPLASTPEPKYGIYVASRASQPRLPEMWKALRRDGWPIISTWIDESGPGETESMAELWSRIVGEVRSAGAVVFYADQESLPLRGEFVEVGIALAFGIPVLAVLRNQVNVGSWINHPLVDVCEEFPSLAEIQSRIADMLPPVATLTTQAGAQGPK